MYDGTVFKKVNTKETVSSQPEELSGYESNDKGQVVSVATGRIIPFAERIQAAIEADDNIGFCVKCKQEYYNIPPSARQFWCKECKCQTVYGTDTLKDFLENHQP